MTTSLEHPKGSREPRGGPPLSRRGRGVAFALATLAVVLLVAGLAAAVGGSGPFAGDDALDEAADPLPSGWVGLEPLLPLAPGLKEMSDLKRSATGRASRVLAARGGSDGALRVRALPPVGASVPAPGPVPAAPPSVRLPSGGPASAVGARRLLRRAPSLGDLATIIDRELGGLPGGAVDGVVQIPPIDPLPNGIPRVVIPAIDPIPEVVIPPVGGPLPGFPLPGSGEPVPGVPLPGSGPVNPLPGDGVVPGSGVVDPLPGGVVPGSGVVSPLSAGVAPARRPRPLPPLNLTVGDLRADPRLDVLLVSRGRRVLERYTFRDDDVSGLSLQINLGSRLLAAEALGDAGPLAHVAAAPLARAGAQAKAPVAGSLPGAAKAGVRAGAGPGVRGARRAGRGASGASRGSAPAASRRAGSPSRRGSRPGGRKAGAGSAGGQANGSSPRRARRGSRSFAPSRGRARPNRGAQRGGSSSPRGHGRHRGRGRSSRGHGHSKPKKHRSSSRGSHGRHGRGHGDDDDGDDD